jgi:putative ABC transport system ATP-binding protein
VILADESTGNLDSQTGAAVIDLSNGLETSHGATILVATHDAELAARARRLAMRDACLASGTGASGFAVAAS